MEEEPLVEVERLSKKFCRSLKRSLWYGMKDIGKEILAVDRQQEGLRKGEFWALHDVSFTLRRGESIGLVGANGAGKSTLLRLLSGLMVPDKGRITMRGRVQALIALGAGFLPVLTGRENILINGAILGMKREEIDRKLEEIIAFADLGEFIDSPLQSYSSGMAARLGFSVAAHVDPDVLLIDEVLSVGDIAFRTKCQKFMLELVDRGVCLVVVSHGFSMLQSMCQKLIWIDRGEVKAIGTPWEVYSQYKSHMLSARAGGQVVKEGAYEVAGEILSIEIFDEEGRPTWELPYGRPWSVEVTVLGNIPTPSLRMLLNITHHQSHVAFASMFEEGLEFDLERGKNVLRIRFEGMPLLPGEEFSLHCAFRDLSASVYLIESVVWNEKIRVTGCAFPEADSRMVTKDWAAPVVIPHTWEGPVRRSVFAPK